MSRLSRHILALMLFAAATPSLAFDPEIGTAIASFPIVHAGGQALDWKPDGASFRILIVSASWCEPCQVLRASLPGELARLRRLGIPVTTIVVEADDFGPKTGGRPDAAPAAANESGYIMAAPDPARIDLAKESPRGVRSWGAFRAFGYPTTILLDERNLVLERYRGGRISSGVFNDVIRFAQRAGRITNTPIEEAPRSASAAVASAGRMIPASTKPAVRDPKLERAGDELIGLWKINNPEAKDPRALFLRVIGVSGDDGATLQLEASLSHKLTKWTPIEARCEMAEPACILHLTTHNGGKIAAKRQPHGTYAGTLTRDGRVRQVVRAITMEPMSLDEAEL